MYTSPRSAFSGAARFEKRLFLFLVHLTAEQSSLMRIERVREESPHTLFLCALVAPLPNTNLVGHDFRDLMEGWPESETPVGVP